MASVSWPNRAQLKQITDAARILKRGGVVGVPTDTLYGLAADVFSAEAVERIFLLKGRRKGMPLPILLANAEDMVRCSTDIPEVAWDLVERFWPGALTIVLRKSANIPAVVSGGLDTVALRVPDHWIPRLIVKKLGSPITGTSANRSGKPSLTMAQEVRDEFKDAIDLVIEGGRSTRELASTVLDLSEGKPIILRPGVVPQSQIDALCGRTTDS